MPGSPRRGSSTATRTSSATSPGPQRTARSGATEQGIALFHAVRDGIRYDPYDISYERTAFRASSVVAVAHQLVRPEVDPARGLGAASRDPGPARVRRRPEPPDEREVVGHDGNRPVRLARLRRTAAPRSRADRRSPMVQVVDGVQHRALRTVRRARRSSSTAPTTRSCTRTTGPATGTWSTCASAAATTICRSTRSCTTSP